MVNMESHDAIAVLTLDHGKVNLIDVDLLSELIQRLDEVEEAPARAAVLTGAGASFSAGVDLFKIINGGKAYLDKFLPKLTEGLYRLFTFPKPIVAAVNGHAIAGGCLLAWSCDTCLMAQNSGRIGVVELAVGIPFPSLPLEIVRFTVPVHAFQTVVYSGRTYEPEDALKLGLVDEVVEAEKLMEQAFRLARQLATIPPDSFATTKRLMRQPTLDRHERFKQTIDQETARIWASKEILEVIRAYLEKTVGKKS